VTPETRYARLQGDRIAYQVLGGGPPDLVLTPGSFAHIDIAWEDPGISLFCRTLASFCRLIVFDRRGTGLSDPLPPDPLPPWESYAQDLTAVLDEVGAERTALLAEIDAGPTAIFFAATQPERTSALILSHTTARFVAADDYPIGIPAEVAETLLAQMDQFWGSEAMAALAAPSRAGDQRFRRWLGKLVRAGASPGAAQRFMRAIVEVDVRPALPLIQAPNPGPASTGRPVHPYRAWTLPRRAHPQGKVGRASRGRPDPHLGDTGACPGPHRGVPDRRPPRRTANADPGHGAVHRHRGLHRAGQPAGGPALAGAAGGARRAGPAAGRGVRRPADQDHRRRDGGDLRRTGTGDPLRGRAQRRAGGHRRPDPGRAAHRRG
jgi:hypothetical protein